MKIGRNRSHGTLVLVTLLMSALEELRRCNVKGEELVELIRREPPFPIVKLVKCHFHDRTAPKRPN
jgi:hypothetical protein